MTIWNTPPGTTYLPGEAHDPHCEVCGEDIDYCECEPCPCCGAQGDPNCLIAHSVRPERLHETMVSTICDWADDARKVVKELEACTALDNIDACALESARDTLEAGAELLKANNTLTLSDWTDAESVRHWQRDIYEYTECGAYLAVHVPGRGVIETDDDTARLLGPSTVIDRVVVGSTNEAVYGGTGEIEVTKPSELDAAIAEVEAQAASIWDDTHGCETCAAHWVAECGNAECGSSGGVPIWAECPDCSGDGGVI